MKMDELSYIFVALMVVVILFQALQINSISNQLAEAKTVASVQTTASVQASPAAPIPSSLNDLPSMVGGC